MVGEAEKHGAGSCPIGPYDARLRQRQKRYAHQGWRGAIRTDAQGVTAQVVGLFLASPHTWRAEELRGRPAAYTVIAYAVAAVATIGYLLALAAGPAAIIVPLVATSPALAGLLGIAFLHERASGRQYAGIVLAMAGGVLLSTA